uniref:Oxalate:formate antiporter n=3 Tax=Schistocephalus solidus TaxID=70667 RepID=A0A0X3PQJ8_SCHSO
MEKKDLIWGILSVTGAVLLHLSFGYFYTVGNMNPYLIAYMGIQKSQSIWFNAVMFAMQSVSMPIGGILQPKIGFRAVTVLGIILSSGGIMLSRLTVDYGLGPFIATYCILFGLGIGLPYSVLMSVAASWFPKYRATIVGIIAAGFGCGALLFTPIQTSIINPQGLKNLTDPSITAKVPNAFLILGGVMLGLQIIGFIICREKKVKDTTPVESSVSSETPEESRISSHAKTPTEMLSMAEDEENELEIHAQPVQKSYTLKEALRTIDFYLLWFIFFCNVIPSTLLSSTYKVYGTEKELGDHYLSIIATLSSAFNALGRALWGIIVDHFSFKCPLGILTVLWAVLFATFPAIGTSSVFLYIYPVWVFALFFLLAGHFVIMPGACTRIFGPKNMATLYGLIFFATAPSSLLLSAIISQFTIDGKWIEVYLSAAAICLISFILSIFLTDKNGTCTKITDICARACDVCRPISVDEEEIPDEKYDFEGGSVIRVL